MKRLSPSEAIERANKLAEQLRARTSPPLRMRGQITKEERNHLSKSSNNENYRTDVRTAWDI